MIDSRLVIEAFEESSGDELDEIVISLGVFAQQNQVIGALVRRLSGVLRRFPRCPALASPERGTAVRRLDCTIVAASFGDVNFAADDRLYAASLGLVIEILRGEKIPVVGDGHGGHSAPRGFFGQLLDFAGAIQKTVIRVQMQMYESGEDGMDSYILFPSERFSYRLGETAKSILISPAYADLQNTRDAPRRIEI